MESENDIIGKENKELIQTLLYSNEPYYVILTNLEYTMNYRTEAFNELDSNTKTNSLLHVLVNFLENWLDSLHEESRSVMRIIILQTIRETLAKYKTEE
jgi:RNase adaptor protein for sRNA GlmZ degradation